MQNKLLVIPGHLGKDSGATVSGQTEALINLQQAIGFCIAHESSAYSEELDVKLVVPNGEVLPGYLKVLNVGTSYFSISSRINLVNKYNADLIEIHNNSAPFYALGAEVLCYSKESEGYGAGLEILEQLEQKMTIKNRGVKPIFDTQKGIFVNRQLPIIYKTKNTSIITEAGFLSNENELDLLDVDLDGWNEQIGACIWRGWINYWTQCKNI